MVLSISVSFAHFLSLRHFLVRHCSFSWEVARPSRRAFWTWTIFGYYTRSASFTDSSLDLLPNDDHLLSERSPFSTSFLFLILITRHPRTPFIQMNKINSDCLSPRARLSSRSFGFSQSLILHPLLLVCCLCIFSFSNTFTYHLFCSIHLTNFPIDFFIRASHLPNCPVQCNSVD